MATAAATSAQSVADLHASGNQQVKHKDFHADGHGQGYVALYVGRGPARPAKAEEDNAGANDDVAFNHCNDELNGDSDEGKESQDGREDQGQGSAHIFEKACLTRSLEEIPGDVQAAAEYGAWGKRARAGCALPDHFKTVNDCRDPGGAKLQQRIEASDKHQPANHSRCEALQIRLFEQKQCGRPGEFNQSQADEQPVSRVGDCRKPLVPDRPELLQDRARSALRRCSSGKSSRDRQ